MRDFNFLHRTVKTRLLLASIGIAMLVSVVLGGMLLVRGNGHPLSATIGDNLAMPSETPARQEVSVVSPPKSLSDTAATSLASGIGSDTVRYYEAQTGKAFQVDIRSHAVTILSDKKLAGFTRTIWSPDKEQVVSVFAQPSGTVSRYYSYVTGRTMQVGSSVQSSVFSPNSRRLAFLETGVDRITIYEGSADGTDAGKVLDTRVSGPEISWPTENSLALYSRHHGGSGGDLTLVGLDSSLSPLLSNMENLEYLWSRDGSKLLYSYFEPGKGIHLWYLDVASRASVPLGIPTSARKCAWHQDMLSVTCGVPSNTTLSRDVAAANSATLDDIITINIANDGQQTHYRAQAERYVGVIDPIVSSSDSFFVFLNLFDQKVYALPL